MNNFRRRKFSPQIQKPSLWRRLRIYIRDSTSRQLGTCAGLGFIGICLSGLFTFQFAQYRLRSSEFNNIALNELSKHEKLYDLLGRPVITGYVYSRTEGSITPKKVDCVVPVSGKKADGLIKYQADKVQNKWIVRKMEFTFLDEAGGVLRLISDTESEDTAKPQVVCDINEN